MAKMPKIATGIAPRGRQSFAFTVRVLGEAEIKRRFKELGEGRQRRAIKSAMGPAAQELKRAAKSDAPKRSGRMRRNLTSKVALVPKRGTKQKVVVGIVGIKRKIPATPKDAGKLSQTSQGTRPRRGRGQIKGTDWFRGSHRRKARAARRAFEAKFMETMLREIRRKEAGK